MDLATILAILSAVRVVAGMLKDTFSLGESVSKLYGDKPANPSKSSGDLADRLLIIAQEIEGLETELEDTKEERDRAREDRDRALTVFTDGKF